MLKIESNILTTVANFYVPSSHIVFLAIANNIRFRIDGKNFPLMVKMIHHNLVKMSTYYSPLNSISCISAISKNIYIIRVV
jgi:hypothetical protein